jgi:CrcB protein
MMIISLVGLGVLGVGLRFLADSFLRMDQFPLATFSVNILGCFLAGAIFSSGLHPDTRLALIVGFCGGLTTFSSLIIQCLQFMKDGLFLKAFAYLAASLIFGLVAAWAGMRITQGN